MNAVSVLVILATVGFSSAIFWDKIPKPSFPKFCNTEADCEGDKCCGGGKICVPKLPVGSSCFFTNLHKCGCVSGSSCQVTKTFTLVGKTFYIRQCVNDSVGEENNDSEKFRRVLVRKCSTDSVAQDCGRSRCCIGGKYCSPLIPKYFPCNFEDAHKCQCDSGLECRVTKKLKIPGFLGIAVDLKQCMPAGESNEIETVEMTEN